MLSEREILFGIVLPLVVSLCIGLAGRWSKQAWLMPLGCGVGFLVGYCDSLGSAGGFGLPRLPPQDGTDWLFWTTLPAIALATFSATKPRRWHAAMGLWAGVVVFAIARPLVPGTLSLNAAILVAILAAVTGVALVRAQSAAAKRLGDPWTVASLYIVLGAAGVTVLSSNLRTVGVYGLGASAAVVPLILLTRNRHVGGSLAILAISILSGLLTAGHYYPDPGLTPIQTTILGLSPLLVLIALRFPARRPFLAGVAALLAVTIAVLSIAAPSALAAKRAAEGDPYGSTPGNS